MRVYRVSSPNSPSNPEDWGWLPKQVLHERAIETIFVTSSVDRALAWALHLVANQDDYRDQLEELEVKCIRDFTLSPIRTWLKSDLMSWASDVEIPFRHPRFKTIRRKWSRFIVCPTSEVERATPTLSEALVLPEDIISIRVL